MQKIRHYIPFDIRRAVLLFVLAFGIRLIYLALFPAGPLLSDPWRYYELARSLGETGKYIDFDGSFTAYRPPGTSIILVPFVFMGSRWLIDLAFAGMTSLTVALAYLFFIVCGTDRKISTIAGLLFAIFPSGILYSGFPNSEVPFTLLLFAAFIVLATRKKDFGFFKTGFILGAATLFRTMGLLVLPIALWFDYRLLKDKFVFKTFLKRAILLILGFTIIIAPWSIRNMVRLGTLSLSTNTGINLRIGNFDSAHGGYNADAQTLPDSLPEVTRNREYTSMALNWMVDNPVKWLKLIPKKVLNMWALQKVGIFLRNTLAFEKSIFWDLFFHILWAVFLILGIIAAGKNWRFRDDPIFALSIVAVVGITLFHLLFFGSGRFRFPVEWAVAYWIAMDLSNKKRRKKLESSQ